MRIRAMKGLALGALMLTVGGCSDSDMGEVSLQLATRGPTSMAEWRTRPTDRDLGAGRDRGGRGPGRAPKGATGGAPTASCPEDAEGDSRCAALRLGPTLFDLPLGEGAEPIFSAAVPVGTYSGIKFQIHRPPTPTRTPNSWPTTRNSRTSASGSSAATTARPLRSRPIDRGGGRRLRGAGGGRATEQSRSPCTSMSPAGSRARTEPDWWIRRRRTTAGRSSHWSSARSGRASGRSTMETSTERLTKAPSWE